VQNRFFVSRGIGRRSEAKGAVVRDAADVTADRPVGAGKSERDGVPAAVKAILVGGAY